MPGVAEPCLLRDVSKLAISKVVEEVISVSYGGHEQIRLSIIIDIGKGGRCTDLPAQAHSRLLGNILKPAATQIPPKLITTKLVHEINVVESVAVDVGHSDAIAVVIMIGLVIFLSSSTTECLKVIPLSGKRSTNLKS